MSDLIAVRRAWTCCELLAARPDGVAFSELAAACGDLAPASAARLLKALVAEGIAARADERGYRPGPRLRALLDRDPLARVQPLLAALAEGVGESVALFAPLPDGVRLLAKHELDERFRYMAPGGENRREAHGANRLRRDGVEALVNRDDDQPGIARVCAACRDRDGVLRGIVCITLVAAALAAARERALLAAVRAAAATIARHLEGA